MNKELYIQKSEIRKFIKQQKMRIKSLSLYTQALNSSNEHSENVIKQKIIIMKSSFNLFKKLWLKITHAVIYFYNQTSHYFLNWKSSYEFFHTYLTHQESVVIEEWKLQQVHLKIYNCKTYYMTTYTLKKTKCFNWLKSKIWINYLVSYDSINVYQIWNSVFNKMI